MASRMVAFLKNGAAEIYMDNTWSKDKPVGDCAAAPASPKIKEFVSALKKSGAEVVVIPSTKILFCRANISTALK